jgi:DNA gyrase subunit A
MAIRFEERQVRSMGRVARGVKGIRLRAKDGVVDMVIAQANASLLTVCENGYGKRTILEDYRAQSRGGIGLINIKTTTRNGKVVALKAVRDDDELMMITAKGIIIRTGLEEVRSIGRNTQGVRLIKLGAGDKLVAVEKIASEVANNSTGKADQGAIDTAEPHEQERKPLLDQRKDTTSRRHKSKDAAD